MDAGLQRRVTGLLHEAGVTVDGDQGLVYLADPGAALSPVAHRRLNRWLIAGGTVAAAAGAVGAVVVRHRRRP